MDPIPAWVRRLWDIWDLRMLVMLSFTLQTILSIFGRRRKYISSVWISVLVWSAYLTADWVATVALGKLSDAQDNQEKINALRVLWAPLLLLHLGGPDGITAYSLEDNQLWLRHFMGLVVQLTVAVYVILMSWKKSWFSFMSIPALVAGIIKYGERTWVLHWVSNDEYLDRMPFYVQSSNSPFFMLPPPSPPAVYPHGSDHEYVRILAGAYLHLGAFMYWMEYGYSHEQWVFSALNYSSLEAREVSMGLLYDMLYTKAAAIYSKRGFIVRCISFGCTVTVLLGLAIEGNSDNEENWHEIDTLITWVLIVGAVALEIYAAIVILSSNWTMLWLISQGKWKWVTWLSQRFSCLFNTKKNWSNKVGQFDILGYLLKERRSDVQRSPVRKIIRSVLGPPYEDKWNRFRYKTAADVHPPVHDAILLLRSRRGDILKGSILSELKEIWAEWDIAAAGGREHGPSTSLSATLILEVHLLTEIFYHVEMELLDAAGGEDHPSTSDVDVSSKSRKENREVSKTLSDYMMYLLVMHPSLLPNAGSRRDLESKLRYLQNIFKGDERDVKAACHLLGIELDTMQRSLSPPISGWIRSTVESLKGKEKTKRWEIIKLMWLKMLALATDIDQGVGQKDGHFQRLREGGELLTLIWFFNAKRAPRFVLK